MNTETRGYERKHYTDLAEAQYSCVGESYAKFSYAGTRAWVDKVYPTKESRRKVREEVGNIASGILVGFRSMIDQLNWMSPASKQGAYSKIDNVVKNIAFPDWVTDDEQLDNYYKRLDIDMHNDDYLTMLMKIRVFRAVREVETLLAGPVPREGFSGSAATPSANAITMPGGILRRPFFDPTWPNSVNYGAVGLIIGIRAAFRAYRNSIGLNGPDPHLPDEQFQGFSHDQLFFLSFARVWCRKLGSTSSLLTRLLTDPHSPAPYRVLGTLQNFPAFKEAFNCPKSPYAPDKHCNVWVSELDTSHGEPKVKTELNIAAPPQITPNEKEKYDAAKVAISFFQESVNTSVDPCEDFYKYACGKYQKAVSFHYADAKNLVAMANQLTNKDYQKVIKSSTALTKEKAFFDACVAATKDSGHNNQILISNNYLMKRVRKLADYLGAEFTYALGGRVEGLPNKVQLANALGYLSFDQNIQTLVTPLVDTYWPDPNKGYTMFLDQNTAYMSKTFYHPDAFKTIKENYVNSATKVIETFVKTQNKPIDPKLKDKVRGLVEFEQMIANKYSTDDDTRRIYLRSWNLRSIRELQNQFGFVDWQTYMKMVPKVAQNKVQSADFRVSVMEPGQYANMSRDYAGFDKEKLVNYLFMRLLLSNAQYLPTYASSFKEMPEEPLVLGRKRRNIHFSKSDTLTDTQANCAKVANELMMFANGRVFVDYVYPDEKYKDLIRSSAGGVMHNVIHAFQSMVDQLDWMSEATKRKAIEKSMNIITNIAFPDWIMDNAKLDLYYKSITFDPTKENYYDIWTKLTIFNIEAQYKHLTMATADYEEFLMPPGIVNAWYQPELNTITFPAGILRPPYFHPDWPASIKYGGIGLIAGHELIHGFDDQGVQWGPKGHISYPEKNCIGWMDEQSTKGFNRLAQCVIDEYSTFCPLDNRTYTPNCVNGAQTQGENIADNGGVHAAFRAYRTHISLNGPDPQLPDRLFGQFTHDQLFFLNFAQVWCEKRRVDDRLYQQLMVDPHSPAMYRVFGTLQNYPAFRAAFNCPLNSRYAPKDHCNVWVPNYMP
ncbi:peptidase family M13 [Ancylostoma caninum]|uniref:Peptidase family M13 n=1 Tax=Ancylostoma caninum TaxID=29170 RepID=A0A368H9P2_ANCCA|nr:peptidase family M13 [Ancylostoma caninum]